MLEKTIIIALLLFSFYECTLKQNRINKNHFNQEFKDTLEWKIKAEKMVEEQIIARGIADLKVIEVMKNTPRHLFVPAIYADKAYGDHPLPIGENQTISQPYIVALMTELLELKGTETVLEIGTGSGYQAAILSPLVRTCYSIELIPVLADSAQTRLKRLNYSNVIVKCGDGYKGWAEHAPFDCIIITAAPPEIPHELINQLKVGGKMVVPVGQYYQELLLITKTKNGIIKEKIAAVRFVPMVKPNE